MAAELLTGLGLFKAMFDTAKGLKDINDATVRNGVVVELQEKILAAQAQQSTLIERISQLEKEVAGFEVWDREKKRYQLTDFGSGTFAYVLKKEECSAEPMHRICAACCQQDRKSILQFQLSNYLGQDVYHCPRCQKDIGFGTPREPSGGGPIDDSGSWMSA